MPPKRCTVAQGCLRVSYNLRSLGVGVCVRNCRISVSCGVELGINIFDCGWLGGEVCSQGGSSGHGLAVRANSACQAAHDVLWGGPIPGEHNPCPSVGA